MINNCIIEERVKGRIWVYNFLEKNSKGETITIALTRCEDNEMKNSLPKIWFKKGYTNKVLNTYWCIDTYVRDSEGACYGRYNPTIKLDQTEKRNVINFDWKFEATEENKEKLINEVYRLFSTSRGESATEIKNKKILEYALKNKVDIYREIPEGWKKLNGCVTAPIGTVWISNNKSFKTKERKTAILLVV